MLNVGSGQVRRLARGTAIGKNMRRLESVAGSIVIVNTPLHVRRRQRIAWLERVREDWRALPQRGPDQELIELSSGVMSLAMRCVGAYSEPGLCRNGHTASLATRSSLIDR